MKETVKTRPSREYGVLQHSATLEERGFKKKKKEKKLNHHHLAYMHFHHPLAVCANGVILTEMMVKKNNDQFD